MLPRPLRLSLSKVSRLSQLTLRFDDLRVPLTSCDAFGVENFRDIGNVFLIVSSWLADLTVCNPDFLFFMMTRDLWSSEQEDGLGGLDDTHVIVSTLITEELRRY